MKVSEIITEHKKGRRAVKYNKKPKPYIEPKKPQAPSKPNEVNEARRRKKKVKRAAYGPGPFGMYGTNVGYSGDGGAVGETIKKVGSQYQLVSKKTGKNLGTYPTKAGAEKRERQVQYFKHAGK